MHILCPANKVVRTEIEIKKSRFITTLTRVNSESEAREFINSVKREYPDARHNCSAYIVSPEQTNPITRSSDDGEPSGTAGMPILEVLTGSKMVNIAAVVTRYFGGTLLGTGGLVRAYSQAVQSALEKTQINELIPIDLYTLELPHATAGRTEAELRTRGWEITEVSYGEHVTLTVASPPSLTRNLFSAVLEICAGTVTPVLKGTIITEQKYNTTSKNT